MTRSRPHPHSTNIPAKGDHLAWAAHWGAQAARAMQGPSDLDAEHAVRAARIAWMHACRKMGYKYWSPEWCAQHAA